MLADWRHGACLQALDPFLFRGHKADFTANIELFEAVTDDAILVEIDLLAFRRFGKAIVIEQAHHLTVLRSDMRLHVATHAPDMVFELPPCRVERIANGDIDILVRMVQWPSMADEYVLPRHADVDADIVCLLYTSDAADE